MQIVIDMGEEEYKCELIPIDMITDIVSEIEAQDPADCGRTYQEKAAAESMKRNILEIIRERVKYE